MTQRTPDRGPAEPLADQEPAHPLDRRAMQRERSLERYLAASVMPRYMERLREIQDETRVQQHRLAKVYAHLQERLGAGTAEFAARWTERAHRWRFDDVNELIDQHNDYYPLEAQLALDPRTGDYVKVAGRPYVRERLGPEWILERFPAT